MADQPPINPNDPNARLIDQLNRLNEHLARMNERAEETLAAAQQSTPTGESGSVSGQGTRDAEFTRLVDKLIERIDAQRTEPSQRPGQPNSSTGSHPPDEHEERRDRQARSRASLRERLSYVHGEGEEDDDRSRLAKFIDPRKPQGTASTPPLNADDAAVQKLLPGFSQSALGDIDKPIKLLPFGEYQLDTKLALGRDFLARAATRGIDEDGNQPSAWRRAAGQAAGGLNQLHDIAPQIHGAMRAYEKLSASLEHTRDIGENMGFDPWAGSIGAGGYGVSNPLGMLPGMGSAAAKQGWQVRLNDARMRFMPGIGEETGKEISSSLMGEGWSGRDLNALSFQYSVPLAQHGVDPEISAMFSQALKGGNTSIPELVKSLSTLGTSARDARMPLDQYAKSLNAFADQMEQHGLTRQQSIDVGQNFTGVSGGLDPQIAGQWMQNPLFQGMAMSKGFMPSQVGLMGGGGIAQTQLQVMRMAMGAAGGFRHDRTTNVGGMEITTSGDDMQMAQAASIAGMRMDDFKRVWQGRQGIEAAGNVDKMGTELQTRMDAVDTLAKAHKAHPSYSAIMGIGQGRAGAWNEITTQARKAGVTSAEIKQIQGDDKSKWTQELRQKVADHTKQQIDDGKSVKLDLTDRAAKVLHEVTNTKDTPSSADKAVSIPITSQLPTGVAQPLGP